MSLISPFGTWKSGARGTTLEEKLIIQKAEKKISKERHQKFKEQREPYLNVIDIKRTSKGLKNFRIKGW